MYHLAAAYGLEQKKIDGRVPKNMSQGSLSCFQN